MLIHVVGTSEEKYYKSWIDILPWYKSPNMNPHSGAPHSRYMSITSSYGGYIRKSLGWRRSSVSTTLRTIMLYMDTQPPTPDVDNHKRTHRPETPSSFNYNINSRLFYQLCTEYAQERNQKEKGKQNKSKAHWAGPIQSWCEVNWYAHLWLPMCSIECSTCLRGVI